jgi:hypothetical protein
MKHLTIITMALLLFFSVGHCSTIQYVQQASTINSYTTNLVIYLLWVFSDLVCLTLGWGGILFANDAGAVYNQCQLSFIDWYTMEA